MRLEERRILQLNEIAAKSGCVDMIDLEFFEAHPAGERDTQISAYGSEGHCIAS